MVYNRPMALQDMIELQKQADALNPEEQILLANYLLGKAKRPMLQPATDLSEFRGAIKLTKDPLEFQRSIRAEWP